jgi:3-phenylpropionate/trans-cinnamate dioxygenase ferredoxin reductase subunit
MTQTASPTFAIIGGGQAGAEIAGELRKQGFDGRVVILGEEAALPYKRPPLSKAYLAGGLAEESLYVMQKAGLEKANIEFRGGARVVQIDREAKQLKLPDGSMLAYDKLAIATGGRARELKIPGADRPNVLLLRTIADVEKIRALAQAGKRAVIIGGGFIGLEAAATLVKHGVQVTVLEGLPRVLARVTSPEVSAFFERVHREAGVDLRTGVQITSFEYEAHADAAVTHIHLSDHSRVEADFIIVGIGVVPNTELAEGAGLVVDNGIVVDDCTRTSDPDIVAAGDCTNHPNEFLNRRVRLESVQNAMEQGRAAARTMLGKPETYKMVPWFWSDQFDLKLQMVGISTGYDQIVIRGDLASRAFAAFYLHEGHVIAADTVSKPLDFMLAKKMVAARMRIDPAQLADETVALKSLLPAG